MSTNKLTWEELNTHCVAGRLHIWLPKLLQNSPAGRCLYMFPAVHEALQTRPWPASDREDHKLTKVRRQAMRAVLERFVKGAHINLNYDLKELGSESSNPKMRGYWEFRSGKPMEETRLFGFFVREGAFLATDFQRRGLFPEQITWQEQRDRCQAKWNMFTMNAPSLQEPWPVVTQADLKPYLECSDD